jgi:hypothetical protein
MSNILIDFVKRLRRSPRRERPPHDSLQRAKSEPFRLPHSRARRRSAARPRWNRWSNRFHRCAIEQCEQRVLLTFHLWKIDQVFSSADGKVQFIELQDPADGENHTAGHFISSNENKFTFPADLSTDATANKHFLIGTSSYAALPGAATPDYIIPDNFFSPTGDTFDYADVDSFSFTAGQMPTDGSNALVRDVNSGNLSTGKNSETNLAGQTASVTVSAAAAGNKAPTLDPIADPAPIVPSSGQQTINLSGITAGQGETQNITVSASSDNAALVPDPTVHYTSAGATGTLTYTPLAGAQGTATITVTVKDDGGTANGGVDTTVRTFKVRVAPHVNQPPTITPIADPAPILPGAGQQTVTLTGISGGPDETQTVTITATSSNPALLPNPQVNYTSPNSTGTLTYTPVPGAKGSATITVTLKDDGGTANGGTDTTVVTFSVAVGLTAQQVYVQHLIEDVLGREPTGADLQLYSGQLSGGASRADVAQAVLSSPEHLQGLIGTLYQKLLGRTADSGGMTFWAQQLANGMDETAVAAAMVGSDEFFNLAGGTMPSFIDALYEDLLGRSGESTGVAFWQSALAAGASHQTIALGFTASPEFHGLLVDDPGALLAALPGWFQSYFHRNADDAGRAFFVNQLNGGASSQQTQIEMLASDEYFGRNA